jgi:hypothetical protein
LESLHQNCIESVNEFGDEGEVASCLNFSLDRIGFILQEPIFFQYLIVFACELVLLMEEDGACNLIVQVLDYKSVDFVHQSIGA